MPSGAFTWWLAVIVFPVGPAGGSRGIATSSRYGAWSCVSCKNQGAMRSVRTAEIPAYRGVISDRRGEPLGR